VISANKFIFYIIFLNVGISNVWCYSCRFTDANAKIYDSTKNDCVVIVNVVPITSSSDKVVNADVMIIMNDLLAESSGNE